jgi:hypothetical protein
MGRVHSPDPEVFDYRVSSGCAALFGLPFLLGGLFAIVLSFTPEARRARDVPPWYILLPTGALIAGIGVLLVFTRRGTIVDRRNERVTRWWGLLRPMRSTTRPLADFDRVQMTQAVRRARNRSYTVYPVRLAGPKGLPLTVDEKLTHAGALELAKDLATFAGLRLIDHTMGSPIERLAEEVAAPLRQRQTETGGRVAVPDPPADARSRVEVLGETICFDIPAPGLRRQHLWLMGLGLVVPVVIYVVWLRLLIGRGAVPPVLTGLLVVLLMGGPFVLGFLLPLGAATMRTRIEASPAELRVTFRGLLLRRTRAVLTQAIDELEVADLAVVKGQPTARGTLGKVIVARSEQDTLAFGAGLSEAELDWMRSVLWNVATA